MGRSDASHVFPKESYQEFDLFNTSQRDISAKTVYI